MRPPRVGCALSRGVAIDALPGRSQSTSESPTAMTRSRSSGELAALRSGRLAGLLRRDPAVDPRLQHVERQGAGAEHLVVEPAHVEARAELLLLPLAQLEDLELPDLVAERLPRPDHVAVGLAMHLDLIDRRVVVEELHDLVARPVLRMHAGVDDEADGAQHLVLQAAVVAVGVLVEADLL